MADSSLIKKLLIKTGYRMVVINAPPGYLDRLGPLPEGAKLQENLEGAFDFVHLFAADTSELALMAPAAIGAVKRDGVLWISYPKGRSKVKTDLSRDKGWDVVRSAGFEGVSLVSIDDVWSAMRFRPSDLVSRRRA